MYAVYFFDTNGIDQFSHVFDTLKPARAWVRWLRKQKFCHDVRIYHGGAGGEVVE
jgi:hypothetical protein